jgi:hypothetical protein
VAAEAFSLGRVRGDADGDDARRVDRAAEIVSDDVAAHSALGPSLARVLRMPGTDRDGRD